MSEAEPNKERKYLEDQVVIVTGAAHGIGRGIALEMAREGAKIVIAVLIRKILKLPPSS